eukprot:TRINITY_DN4932_c0_g4_i2.p1 TRINITY_DN4932_c0_g4~~TRINITY_DN4932_c0_g4_i2.p1  ORF type:complete len:369 (+),score=81.00 TRINITY_DN4932_c0_g4_i2:60-1109(+)
MAAAVSERDALAASYDYEKLAAEYHEKGYVSGLQVLTKDELSLLKSYVQYVTSSPAIFNRNFESQREMFFGDQAAQQRSTEDDATEGDEASGTVKAFTKPRLPEQWLNPALEHALIWDLIVQNPVMVRLCRAVFKCDDVQHLSSTIWTKNPLEPGKKPGRVGWHQDLTFWGLNPGKVFTMWLALDDVDAENGALQVVEGSHVDGLVKHDINAEDDSNLLMASQDIRPERFSQEKIRLLELKPGQCSVHDGWTIHGSGPNLSKTRRRTGLTVQFMAGDVIVSKQSPYDSLEHKNESCTEADWRNPILIAGPDRFASKGGVDERALQGGMPLKTAPWATRDWRQVATAAKL